ncbi:MAG: PQQ-binding-like beta-propeller repeat protein [Kofleriaceae bacterium]
MSPARAVLLVALAGGCATTPVRGVVFADRNGDGIRQKDEPGIAGAVVAFERSTFVTTDRDGAYHLDAPSDEGQLWVRIPSGYRPRVQSRPIGNEPVDLPLAPLTDEEAASPLTFVVASDSHVPSPGGNDAWDGGDLVDAIDQAVSLPERPRFFTIAGDMTAGNESYQFDTLQAAVETVGMPWIPVAGNHDWYDGGANYRRYYGIDSYSFDIDNVHFVVWDTNLDADDQIAFLTADLAHVSGGMTVVALAHHSPLDEVAEAMDQLGVDYMFTGHWHANRVIQRGEIREISTQTFVMGSIDQTAPGYRVVTIDDDGTMHIDHREKLVRGQLDLVWPHPGTCVADTNVAVIAAAALDASTPEVSVRVDCGPEQALAPSGGWSFGGDIGALSPGTHSLTLSAVSAAGRREETQLAIEVCPPPSALPAFTSWPQLGGSAEHRNARPEPTAPPLVARWATNVGGTITLGTPIVAGDLAIVVITDNAAGDQGGLVALDLATGAERWRYRTPFPAVGAAAASGDTVVVATKNGEVHAVALADGALRWIHDAAAGQSTFSGSLWAPPTIADGLVYVALQGNFTAIDLATGDPVWARDPNDPEFNWLGSLAAVAVSEGTAIAAFNRTLGVASASATTGAPGWSMKDGRSLAVNASPLVENGVVYLVNAAGTVSASNLSSGSVIWSRNVTAGATEWHYSVTATPALAGGRLFVATQWDDLVALDAASGAVLWRTPAPDGVLNFTHYRDAQAGWPASPVVTGDIVWIGGLDGRLRAFAADDGRELWSTQLGAPITSAVAPTGDALVVASYDGTVRLMTRGTPAAPAAIEPCPPIEPAVSPSTTPGGCAIGTPTSAMFVLFAVLFAFGRRRRTGR